MRALTLWFVCLLVACSQPARLTGRWVYLVSGAPVAVGQADQPAMGGPLHLIPGSPAPGACLPASEYDRAFGESCPHEAEGATPGAETLVRWYCHGKLTVRVRFEQCERRDRLRVTELAISTLDR
jgi:hypothetical protein